MLRERGWLASKVASPVNHFFRGANLQTRMAERCRAPRLPRPHTAASQALSIKNFRESCWALCARPAFDQAVVNGL